MDNKVLDEAVEVALSKFYGSTDWTRSLHCEAMRAALLAALPVVLGEPVGWQYRSKVDDGPWIYVGKPMADTFAKHGHAIRPLYAPSLGEGE